MVNYKRSNTITLLLFWSTSQEKRTFESLQEKEKKRDNVKKRKLTQLYKMYGLVSTALTYQTICMLCHSFLRLW